MLSWFPARRMLLGILEWCIFKSGGQSIIPAVEESKARDNTHDLDKLVVIIVAPQTLDVLVFNLPR